MNMPRPEKESVAALVSVLAFVGVVVALRLGFLPPGLRPVPVFLLVWMAIAIFIAIATGVQRARVRISRAVTIQPGLRLRTPVWATLGDPLYMTGLGARIAVVPGAIGFPGVGLGFLLASAALSVAFYLMTANIGVNSITIEEAGMRAQVRGATLFIPWTSIAEVERSGKNETRKLIFLRVRNREAVAKTLDPDTPRTRSRLNNLTLDQDGRLLLSPWIGGLDSHALQRAINTAIGRDGHRSN